ncbi:hypothetical protein GYMLUDRAFT_71519 [Collybiopsis luxurians FD-317 M1]|uniref:HMG box domain-containing protein n=1 Tax=Collybiopsis luxurians FD-317 M1 TaxID=944289 RepID=A0A0D0BIY2_9AGAR|nr:hypothetical protein GYMLUDRAFT_71519 [Collybiopsis luxurians FD-317 M1]
MGRSRKTTQKKQVSKKIPRPMNAFMLYRCHRQKILQSQRDHPKQAELSKEIGATWGTLSPRTRAPYFTLALSEAEKHRLAHPDYQYRPVQKKKKDAPAKKQPRRSNPPSLASGMPPQVDSFSSAYADSELHSSSFSIRPFGSNSFHQTVPAEEVIWGPWLNTEALGSSEVPQLQGQTQSYPRLGSVNPLSHHNYPNYTGAQYSYDEGYGPNHTCAQYSYDGGYGPNDTGAQYSYDGGYGQYNPGPSSMPLHAFHHQGAYYYQGYP